ncbi:MAG: glutathione S-transferase family protein [Beijerinckiaceae bacterium]
MLTIYGRINSINVQKPVLACEELRLPYKRIDAGGAFGMVKSPEYMAMNPNSLVPVLVDGDVVLWESNAIVRYLGAKYGDGKIWPRDPVVRAHSDRWMDWQTTAFYPAYAAAFKGIVRTPPEQQNAAEIEASRKATEPMTAILDAALAGRSYLATDHPTIGDIALAPSVFRWLHMPIARESRPNVEAWCARMAARPGYGNALVLPIT